MVCVCTKHYPRCNVWVAQKFQHELWLLTTETWRVTFDVADDKKTLWLGASNDFMNSFGDTHLLRILSDDKQSIANGGQLRASKLSVVSLGESVAAYGFPYADILSSSGNFTVGNITSLIGMRDDTRFLQMSTQQQRSSS